MADPKRAALQIGDINADVVPTIRQRERQAARLWHHARNGLMVARRDRPPYTALIHDVELRCGERRKEEARVSECASLTV